MVGESWKGIVMPKRGPKSKNTESQQKKLQATKERILNPIEPQTPGQADFLDAIRENQITVCDGLAGTGKSFLSFGSALRAHLEEPHINRIILVRPTLAAGDDNDLGYLPGDLNEKMAPFISPLIRDSASLLLKSDFYKNRLISGTSNTNFLSLLLTKFDIEVVPLQFMRGRTFNNAFIILDEAQNCTLRDFKLFLTRIGKNSKVIIEGDSTQADRSDGALPLLFDKLKNLPDVALIKLGPEDIVRNPIIQRLLDRLS